MILLAHSAPEGLLIVAIIAVVTGLAWPLFERLGFGTLVSLLFGMGCGVVVVGALMIRARIEDILHERRWRGQRSKRREESSEGQNGG
jgi:hypothetical protein